MDLKILDQITIEDKYSKREINTKIWEDLSSSEDLSPVLNKLKKLILAYKATASMWWKTKVERIYTLTDNNTNEEILTYICVGVMKSGYNGRPFSIQTATSYIASKLEGFEDHMDAVRTASELIAVGATADLYDVITAKDSESGSIQIRSLWALEDHTEQYIRDTMYLPPIICKAKEVNYNADSCYINPHHESVILKHYNHHNEPLGLDAINIAASVRFSLDEFVLNNFEETPNKETDTPEKVRNFQLLKNSSKDVYNLIMDKGNEFSFGWRFCKRGRMHSQGYHINIQSTEFKKALINLAEPVLIPITRSKK